MQATNGIAPETKAEAAAWLVRLHADDRSDADETAFRDWLRAKPENSRAFEAVTTLWDAADGLRAHAGARRTGSRLRRRTVLASLGALTLSGVGFGVWDVAYAGVYETDIGEQKHVTLSDGTEVFLDTDTRIRERYTSSLRIVELDRGRADFRVKLDARRPFVVEAGDHRIVADRTTLDVRRDGNSVSVVLLQGRATMIARAAQPAAQRVLLASGERAIVATNFPLHIDKPNLAPLVAWQYGQAIFESDTLAAAAAEMNRYSTFRLVVEDPVVAKMKLSGVYRVGDNEAFAHSVAQLLPVMIERYADHIVLVRDDSRLPAG